VNTSPTFSGSELSAHSSCANRWSAASAPAVYDLNEEVFSAPEYADVLGIPFTSPPSGWSAVSSGNDVASAPDRDAPCKLSRKSVICNGIPSG